MSKPGQDHVRYEVIVQEDPNSDDLILPIPPQLLQQLGWKEGDDIDFSLTEDGKWIMRKV
jgi:antitoxin component of MazEF toxin-antitoxin module